ncbi:MAG: DUF2500 domain-containing protein [Bacteroides sp.]|nr:DUF2500 domain-containing protein [Bacteroides sp.]
MSKKSTILLILSVLAVMVLAGTTLFFYSHTFVSLKLLLGLAATGGAIGAGIGFYVRQNRKWIGLLTGFGFGGLILACALLTANSVWKDAGSEHEEMATVARKYTERRSKTRRVGRRYVATGEKYTVYYVTLQFENGMTKDVQVNVKEYSRTRTGSCQKVTMTRGFLGWPIYDRVKKQPDEKQK